MAHSSSATPVARSIVGFGFSALTALTALGIAGSRSEAAIPAYTLVGSYTLPSPSAGGGAWDFLPDGRVIQVRSGGDIFVQDGQNASTYSRLGALPASSISGFGASFLKVSPDGTRLAIGDNNFGPQAAVSFVNLADLSAPTVAPVTAVLCPNFDAAWSGNQLYVTGAASSDFIPNVFRIDLSAAPTRSTLITGAGDGSGGVALRGGSLYTGVGYSAPGSPLPAGQIRSFSLGSLNPAIPANFTSGAVVATALSASPLNFDPFGNLLVGGGDEFGGTTDIGYLAIIDLANADPAAWLRLSPAGAAVTYSAAFNTGTNELVVTTGSTAYRYAVPTPAAAGTLALAGLWATRRRRANTLA